MKSNEIGRELSLGHRGVLVVMIAASIMLSACMGKKQPPPEPTTPVVEEPQMYEHRVQYEGETLGLIARWYTGKSSNWRTIVDANPGLRPERINLGDVILIPQEIISQQEPLPKNIVAKVRKATGETGAVADTEAQPIEAAEQGADTETAEAENADEKPDELDQLEQALEAALGEQASEEDAVDAGAAEMEAPAGAALETEEDAERERLLDELLSE